MQPDHKHFVTVIETADPLLYDGPRIAVFHVEKEAEDDLLEFLNEEMDAEHIDVHDAIEEYAEKHNRHAKIDYPDGEGGEAVSPEPSRTAYDCVYIDVPNPLDLGKENSAWVNVHIMADATKEEAAAWIRQNVGDCDDDGRVGLITLGTPREDAPCPPS